MGLSQEPPTEITIESEKRKAVERKSLRSKGPGVCSNGCTHSVLYGPSHGPPLEGHWAQALPLVPWEVDVVQKKGSAVQGPDEKHNAFTFMSTCDDPPIAPLPHEHKRSWRLCICEGAGTLTS